MAKVNRKVDDQRWRRTSMVPGPASATGLLVLCSSQASAWLVFAVQPFMFTVLRTEPRTMHGLLLLTYAQALPHCNWLVHIFMMSLGSKRRKGKSSRLRQPWTTGAGWWDRGSLPGATGLSVICMYTVEMEGTDRIEQISREIMSCQRRMMGIPFFLSGQLIYHRTPC